MRATGQTRHLEGALREDERRLVASRAILGEWLGGSGGGWQDSGGLWPGIKRIEGVAAGPGDPEHGSSRGRLLPSHTVLDPSAASRSLRDALRRSLVLTHGGMAQDVGPILEMVTERYLLRSEPAWGARTAGARKLYDEMLDALAAGDVRRLAAATHANYFGPLRAIIPQAANAYTDQLIDRVATEFGADFWGFWMLGGMAGGGMGFFVAPERHAEARTRIPALMLETKAEHESGTPFAMDPVVYDFAINDAGTTAAIVRDAYQSRGALARGTRATPPEPLETLLSRLGFDESRHERVRGGFLEGRIGLARNRLPPETVIEDARASDVGEGAVADDRHVEAGWRALAEGRVAVVTLAAGVGSRWTRGAGVVKALHPVCEIAGAYRTFLDVHRAKCRRRAREAGAPLPHVVTTSHLTHEAIAVRAGELDDADSPLHLSPGRGVGLRLVPTQRDMRFDFAERSRQRLDERAERVRQSAHQAALGWALAQGEASDYSDPNAPFQSLHPLGHFYEIPNLLRNGVLATLLREQPRLDTLLLHNVDTLGADVNPGQLGWFRAEPAALAFEVIHRWHGDTGGGVARVEGRLRLIEGLALPDPDQQHTLSYYNSMTTWIDVDRLLHVMGLDRAALSDGSRVSKAIEVLADRVPTYVTLKDVKRRWGHGQEDVRPIAQFEKLWSDLSALSDVACRYQVVPRWRGQQLKDPAQLDGWMRDGSLDAVAALCTWA